MTAEVSYTGTKPNWNLIPERMVGSLRRYIEHGIPPGHFLTAVLCNDLAEACGRADDENVVLLNVYVTFLYCYAPQGCWGSREKFESWCKQKGLSGEDKS